MKYIRLNAMDLCSVRKKAWIFLMIAVCLAMSGCAEKSSSADAIDVNPIDSEVEDSGSSVQDIIFPEIGAEELMSYETMQSSVSSDQTLQSALSNIDLKSFSMNTTDGQNLTQDYFAGSKMTLVVLWSPYSSESVYELSDIQYVKNKIGDEGIFKSMGILCDAYDSAAGVRENVISEAKIISEDSLVTFPVAISSICYPIDTNTLPLCIIANETGDIVYAWYGACDLDELMKIVKSVAVL